MQADAGKEMTECIAHAEGNDARCKNDYEPPDFFEFDAENANVEFGRKQSQEDHSNGGYNEIQLSKQK